jgi:hypothetical protein
VNEKGLKECNVVYLPAVCVEVVGVLAGVRRTLLAPTVIGLLLGCAFAAECGEWAEGTSGTEHALAARRRRTVDLVLLEELAPEALGELRLHDDLALHMRGPRRRRRDGEVVWVDERDWCRPFHERGRRRGALQRA